jgi:hypothetical protein
LLGICKGATDSEIAAELRLDGGDQLRLRALASGDVLHGAEDEGLAVDAHRLGRDQAVEDKAGVDAQPAATRQAGGSRRKAHTSRARSVARYLQGRRVSFSTRAAGLPGGGGLRINASFSMMPWLNQDASANLASLYRKIGVNRRSAVVVWARERGIGEFAPNGNPILR